MRLDSFDADRRRAEARAAKPIVLAALHQLEAEVVEGIFAAESGAELNELRLRVQGARLLNARISAWAEEWREFEHE